MDAARRRARQPARSTGHPLYRWALSAGTAAALAYAGLAAATLRDTIDGAPVGAIDAAWPFWLGTFLLALLAGGLAQVVIELSRPRVPLHAAGEQLPSLEDQRRGGLAWVLPAVIAVAAVLLVRLYYTPLAAAVGGLAVLIGTAATVIAHYHLRDEHPGRRAAASLGLLYLTHASAFFLLTMIYSNKWRSMYSGTALGLATLFMLLQLTDGEEIPWLRRLLYAVVGGLLIGEVTWALNYWAASGWAGGATLLILFHFIAGTTVHAIRGSLGRGLLAEYATIAGLAFAVVVVSVTANR